MDVSEINEEASRACVHGQVVGMSPVKTSRNNEELKYVDGHLSDGKEVCRFVSFDVKIKDEIEKIKSSGSESVVLQNCRIKKIGNGDSYELVLSNKSSVASSPKKFKVDDALKMYVEKQVLDNLEGIDHLVAHG